MNRLLLVLAIVLIGITAFTYHSEKGVVVEEKMVVIKGVEDWKNTMIKVTPKDKILIRATGKVCFSGGHNLSCVDADGMNRLMFNMNWEYDKIWCDDPMIKENHAALIGNLGNDDFFIGKKNAFGNLNGMLYIGINDCTLDPGDSELYNTGQYEVFIKVIRPRK
jgi:hypothetical protein